MNPPLTLLAVLAHPDDESFGMGGTLALYASRGVAVHLVCATRGEVGEVSPDVLQGYTSVGELREAELRCAAGHLGLAGVHFLGYRDSGMAGSQDNHHPQALAAQPVENVAIQVASYIRKLRPQVVLTFDPIGGYHHPDHVAIHKATVLAFNDLYRRPAGASLHNPAGASLHNPTGASLQDPGEAPVPDPYRPQKLYFHTMSRRFVRVMVRLMSLIGKDPHHWGKNGDIDLAAMAADDFPVHAVIDYRAVEQRKVAAVACHASQGGMSLSMGRFAWLFRLLVSNRDYFMRAVPPAGKGRRERDLFAD